MIRIDKLVIAGVITCLVAGPGSPAAQAGTLSEAAPPKVVSPEAPARTGPVRLSDAAMDDVTAGAIVPAILLGATLVVTAFTAVVEYGGLGHGCRGINCHNDP